MEVRDYECDIQGIVNNANYLHYTEHTRHLYLQSLGVSFARLHEKGIDPVVARMNLQYKTPLRSDDVFVSKLGIRKEGLRYIFNQDIFRKADNRLCLRATVELCASSTADWAIARTTTEPSDFYKEYVSKWKL